MYCLFEANHNLLTRNYTQYMESIPAEGTPSGGGFSLNKFSLDCLYNEHQKARNVWTKGNKNLPLVRYTGCEFKIYRPTNTDAVLKFQTCYPMTATPLTYTGTQPYMMMMSRGSKKISRLDNTKNKKPYKRFKFKPPEQMSNKWFFSADFANKPLIMLAATAADFENIYISKYSESNTISLRFLNTQIFRNRHFNKLPTTGYHPKTGMWLWAAENGNDPPTFNEMIFLGNTVQYRLGTPMKTIKPNAKSIQEIISDPGFTKLENWGNPFHENYMNLKHQLWWTQTSPTAHLSTHKDKSPTTKVDNLGFNKLQQELFFYGRYNPNRDKGENTQLYYLKNYEEESDWEPPTNQNLILTGFPLWLLIWGNLDYQLKLAEVNHLENNYIAVIKTNKIEPTIPPLDAYILLDTNFTHGDSEWHDEHGRTNYDNIHWFPQVNYQKRTLETLGNVVQQQLN